MGGAEKAEGPAVASGAFAHYVQITEADYFTATPTAPETGKPMMPPVRAKMP